MEIEVVSDNAMMRKTRSSGNKGNLWNLMNFLLFWWIWRFLLIFLSLKMKKINLFQNFPFKIQKYVKNHQNSPNKHLKDAKTLKIEVTLPFSPSPLSQFSTNTTKRAKSQQFAITPNSFDYYVSIEIREIDLLLFFFFFFFSHSKIAF